jgi:hypothetical protein
LPLLFLVPLVLLFRLALILALQCGLGRWSLVQMTQPAVQLFAKLEFVMAYGRPCLHANHAPSTA